MNIVLTILQILGIVLLVSVGLLLLILAVVMFSPLSYKLQGETIESSKVRASVTWLFHLVTVRIDYEDNLLYGVARVVYKKFVFSYDLSKKDETKETEPKKKPKKDKPKDKRSLIDNIKALIKKIQIAYPRIKKILTDDGNKQAVGHLKDEVICLIKMFFPKKGYVRGSFSTGAPDTTGQLCGVLALFPVIYQKDWELRPDFMADEMYFNGIFHIRGRMYVFQMVGILLRIVFDKNCRRMYTMIHRLMKSINKINSQEDK